MPGEPKVDDENSLSPAKFDIPKPEIGEVLTLETGSYTVEQLLSGATSDAYIITRDDGEKFALRLPNLRNVNLDEIELDKPIFVDQTLTLAQVYQQIYSQGSTLSVAQKRELVNKALKSVPPLTGYYNILGCMLEDLVLIQLNEAQNAVNESVIIKRTEGGLWGTCPYSIQEYAPPEYENKQVGSIKDEQRVLIVMLQVAEAMGIAHSQGMALKDFKPPFKGDRIRCDPKGLVKIIDWNITGDNTDIPRDLIYMGGYLHSFLLGVQADVNDLPTHYEIGKGIPNWDVISQAAKNILQRTLSRDPSYRYSSTKQLIDDLAFSIALIDKGHAAQKDNEKGSAGNINGLINDASYSSVQGEYNRVLAIVDIFEKCQIELNEGQKGLLGNLKDVATKELKKKDLTLIAYAKATIFTGNFEKAKSEFLKIVSIIGDPEIKAQAQLLIFLCDYSIALAQAKGCDQYSIPQVRNTTEWQTAQEASDALLSGDLKKAKKLVDNLDHALSADPSLLGVTKNFEVIQDCVKSLSLQTEAKQMWSELQQTETNHGEKFRTLSTILNKFQEGTASAHGIELLDNSAACKNVESALAQAWQELEADYQGIKVKTQQKDTLDKTALSAELGTWIADLRKVSAALSEGDYQLSIKSMLAELEYQRNLLDFGEERTRLLTIIAEQKAQIEQLTPATTPEAGPAQPTGLENPLLDELTRQLNLAAEQLNANAANPAPVLAGLRELLTASGPEEKDQEPAVKQLNSALVALLQVVETTATQASELKSTNASLQQRITDLEQKKKQIEESAVSASVQAEETTAKITTLTDQVEQLRTKLAAEGEQRLRTEEKAAALERQLAEAQAEPARPAEPELPDSASTILQFLTGSLARSEHEFLKHFSEDQLRAVIEQTLSTAFKSDSSLTTLGIINAAIHTDLLTGEQQKSISADQMTDYLIDYILRKRGQSDLAENLKLARKEVRLAKEGLAGAEKGWKRVRALLPSKERQVHTQEVAEAEKTLTEVLAVISPYLDEALGIKRTK